MFFVIKKKRNKCHKKTFHLQKLLQDGAHFSLLFLNYNSQITWLFRDASTVYVSHQFLKNICHFLSYLEVFCSLFMWCFGEIKFVPKSSEMALILFL